MFVHSISGFTVLFLVHLLVTAPQHTYTPKHTVIRFFCAHENLISNSILTLKFCRQSLSPDTHALARPLAGLQFRTPMAVGLPGLVPCASRPCVPWLCSLDHFAFALRHCSATPTPPVSHCPAPHPSCAAVAAYTPPSLLHGKDAKGQRQHL